MKKDRLINLLRKRLIRATMEQTCDEYIDLVWSKLKLPLARQLGSQIRLKIDRQLEEIF